MTRIQRQFAALSERGEKALVAFVTAGDPFAERTADVVCALADGGADIIEIGVPFSDPLADGPTIQAAGFRALSGGMTPPRVLGIVRDVRARGVDIPLVLMGAWNPALQYGVGAFARDCAAAGVDGVIFTDLSPEESGRWKSAADDAGVATIYLLAPTSTPARIALVGKLASGFIYCVSMTGITGVKDIVPESLPALVDAIRVRSGDVPVCVGFGVRRPEQVRAVATFADGIVVGSELVKRLDEGRDDPQVLEKLTAFVASLKAATIVDATRLEFS